MGQAGSTDREIKKHRPRAPVRRQVRSAQAVVGRQLQLAAGAARRFRVEPQRPADRPSRQFAKLFRGLRQPPILTERLSARPDPSRAHTGQTTSLVTSEVFVVKSL